MTRNVAASVRARLANEAKRSHRPFQEVLQYYGLERFLYRFSRSPYREHFYLKGALMFRVWDTPASRPTRDIDFLGFVENEIATMEEIVRAVCGVAVEDDGLRFDPATVAGERITEGADYEGVRVRFHGYLENARIQLPKLLTWEPHRGSQPPPRVATSYSRTCGTGHQWTVTANSKAPARASTTNAALRLLPWSLPLLVGAPCLRARRITQPLPNWPLQSTSDSHTRSVVH